MEAMTYDCYAGAALAGLNAPLFAARKMRYGETKAERQLVSRHAGCEQHAYAGVESIEEKARYARTHGLAGVMIWDIGADDGTLLPAALDGSDGKSAEAR